MTPRTVRVQLLAGFLVCLGILSATLPAYSQRKNENNTDMIGRRTVARRSVVSPDKERAIGHEYAERYESSAPLVSDALVEQYVTTLAAKVVSHSDWKGPVSVKVIRATEAGGFSLPGGYIYLSSGLLLAAENDDEVAAVIAHQVAHAAARHWASELTKMTIMQFAMLPMVGFPSNAAATPVFTPPFTAGTVCGGFIDQPSASGLWASIKDRRQNESEGDYLGLQYVYAAGYDPSAYIAFLARLPPKSVTSRGKHDSLEVVPPVSERIAQARKEIDRILPNARRPSSTPEFVLMKSHI